MSVRERMRQKNTEGGKVEIGKGAKDGRMWQGWRMLEGQGIWYSCVYIHTVRSSVFRLVG